MSKKAKAPPGMRPAVASMWPARRPQPPNGRSLNSQKETSLSTTDQASTWQRAEALQPLQLRAFEAPGRAAAVRRSPVHREGVDGGQDREGARCCTFAALAATAPGAMAGGFELGAGSAPDPARRPWRYGLCWTGKAQTARKRQHCKGL
jgi:hypothetical protein